MEKERIALLIDVENIPHKYYESIEDEMLRKGNIIIKRAYGNWKDQKLNNWEKILIPNAISPIQISRYVQGKNSSDIALVIDAIDIIYSQKVDAICLVTSDSDFTRLATRIRQDNIKVYGVGEKNKVVDSLIKACDEFLFVENLQSNQILKDQPEEGRKEGNTGKDMMQYIANINNLESEIIKLIDDSLDGHLKLSTIGSLLKKKYPQFDVRSYEERKLSDLVMKMKRLEVDTITQEVKVKKKVAKKQNIKNKTKKDLI